jgi:dolichol-phosphate mannosyltransferase
MLKDETPDTGSGLKVFARSMFLSLPMFDHMHRFLPALVIRNRGKVISVEVNHRIRRLGRSKYGLHNRLWVGIVDIFGVMWLLRRPIRPIIKEKIE